MITRKQAYAIANRYGITQECIIVPEMEQANRYDDIHGKSAAKYFEGYMQETARVAYCDEMAFRSFYHDAYGD